METPSSAPSQRPRIAIVGAGPAGLTLAVILKRHGWAASVFDGETAANERDQGGTLDLHPDGGQAALANAGLLDAFIAKARHEDQEQRILDFETAAVLHQELPAPGEGDRPEIDRAVLRGLLLDVADVRWSSRVLEVVRRRVGEYNLRLKDGLVGPFDLVVGADGAWSRVRQALTPTMPIYTGVTFVELWLPDVEMRHPSLSKLVGHGTMFALGDSKGLIAQRTGGEMIRVYAAFRRSLPENGSADIPVTIEKGDLLAEFEGWAPSLRALIANAERIAAVRPIVALPPTLRWPSQEGLVVIGDAAHVMPPLGSGVNLAMIEASELADALVTTDDWRDGVARFEPLMFARAGKIAEASKNDFARMFSDEGAQATLDHFVRRA